MTSLTAGARPWSRAVYVDGALVWRQQRNLQLLQTPAEDYTSLENPREEKITSLKNLVEEKRKNGGVLLVIDSNESKSKEESWYSKLVETLDMYSIFQEGDCVLY